MYFSEPLKSRRLNKLAGNVEILQFAKKMELKSAFWATTRVVIIKNILAAKDGILKFIRLRNIFRKYLFA